MIEIKRLNKVFRSKEKDVVALEDVSFIVEKGEVYGVIGYSGAGKSTLVRCINLLETPDSGEILIDGEAIFSQLPDEKKKKIKEKDVNRMRTQIGMIFQHFNLFDRSTVFENVAYPLTGCGMKKQEIADRVNELLSLVNLSEKANVYPSQLSGGQKQRVAIARALARNPKVLLSDEATSALDPDATESILQLLKKLNKELGLTIIVITHEMEVIKSICHKVAVMEGGRIVEEGDVYDVFASPKMPITEKFVLSSSPLKKTGEILRGNAFKEIVHTGTVVKLSFKKDSVGDAVISELSRAFAVDFNIILANVEVINDIPIGNLVASISGEKEEVRKVLDYLREHKVETEVLIHG